MALITDDYRQEQRRLHALAAGRGGYGDKSFNYAYLVSGIALIERCSTILDYGCGKGSLARELVRASFNCFQYDPAVPAHSAPPNPADLVVCLDVLEHVEPECLDDVLRNIRRLTRKVAFLAIATRPSSKTLTDGSDAHLIIRPGDWWRAQLEEKNKFEVRRVWNTGVEEWVALLSLR